MSLRKTCAAGFAVAVTAGVLLTGAPAHAGDGGLLNGVGVAPCLANFGGVGLGPLPSPPGGKVQC